MCSSFASDLMSMFQVHVGFLRLTDLCAWRQVNYMNTRIQFREAEQQQQQPAKRFNPLRLLGL